MSADILVLCHFAPSYSIPKDIYIETIPFSEDNDLLTPSMKLRRANLKARYAKELDSMRKELNGE